LLSVPKLRAFYPNFKPFAHPVSPFTFPTAPNWIELTCPPQNRFALSLKTQLMRPIRFLLDRELPGAKIKPLWSEMVLEMIHGLRDFLSRLEEYSPADGSCSRTFAAKTALRM